MPKKHHKIFIIAGEASGDNYGALFASEIMKLDEVQIKGWGGDKMKSSGVEISKHYRELAFMGFWEVVKNLRTISKNLNLCWNEIVEYNPDALILVDFPGFNMRIAKRAKAAGIKTYQIICPQIWAWKASRINALAKDYDAIFPALPFEDQILKNGGVNSQSLGHPILDTFNEMNVEKEKNLIALLPGSRKQELRKMLPILINVTKRFNDYKFVIAGAPGLNKEDYKIAVDKGIPVEFGSTKNILARSQAAVITSGTATLEAALLGTKHIITYKTGFFNYAIAKSLVKVDYIGLPNLILGKEVVPELIQGNCTSETISNNLKAVLKNNDQLVQFNELKNALGKTGASKRIASYVLKDSSIS